MAKFFLNAYNVHTGGGKVLLESLIAVMPENLSVVMLLDTRMEVSNELIKENVSIKRVPASILQRLKAEIWLKRNVLSDDLVLNFGNLPPLFRLKGKVVVFLQNRFLVDKFDYSFFSLKTKLRLYVEALWLVKKVKNVDEFIVQTLSMKRLLKKRVNESVKVKEVSFVNVASKGEASAFLGNECNKTDFFYPASGEPHKNHKLLIEAWCLLSKEGFFPSLLLTLEREKFKELCAWIDEKVSEYNLGVKNLGGLTHEETYDNYRTSKALIFPSKFESFGLPLLEASQIGLPILAPELDYVRDVVDPLQSFDPDSEVSVARAVKRFLYVTSPSTRVQTAEYFLQSILFGNK
ncbi:glycosyltransferase [Hydrogenovibrio marinus]|uniref:Glycosyl transferase family 1 domain-containing protein n=1 Tax=Hydrogenovibrio marinus TaxID=28885 RepID=A0A066ZWW7_HYDMR|nr:glycosyltransferase [Hydrogenovibrio marinus]KDN96754.1 hypothetical protein EI16_10955 [Hydrogenovibrio marinus]BBN59004.1 mannosyltransferase [Hydrogenovibrio marinus]